MNTHSNSLRGHRFPREIISQGVWLYYRFSLSLRDVEDLLAKRGITVTHDRENVRCEGSSQRSTGFLSYL
jgi:putative transposase